MTGGMLQKFVCITLSVWSVLCTLIMSAFFFYLTFMVYFADVSTYERVCELGEGNWDRENKQCEAVLAGYKYRMAVLDGCFYNYSDRCYIL